MKPIELREQDFKREIEVFSFPESIKTEFFDYWSEPNKSNTKMRFEMEKTWHLGRRIARWAANGFNSIKNKEQKPMTKPAEPTNDYERLDALLARYLKSPVSVQLPEFRQWYEFMKAENLLKELSDEEKADLKNVYGNDGNKLKAAWVMKTLDGYAHTGFNFSGIMKLRKQLQ